jgi:hypothetical protein
MAFNFAGYIRSQDDWDEFEEFFRQEIELADQKINHLKAEITRFSDLLDGFKHADLYLRTGYSLSEAPDLSWLATPKQETTPPTNTLETVTAIDVGILKKPVLDAIKAKRERNEWKIKRIRDLMEQYQNEIDNINSVVEIYEDVINRVTSRFTNTDFPEVQQVDKQNETEQDPSKLAEQNPGVIVVKGISYYTVYNISSESQIILFEGTAPPVAIGGTINIIGGQNAGTKTVKEVISYRELKTVETLITETPKDTVVTVKKTS